MNEKIMYHEVTDLLFFIPMLYILMIPFFIIVLVSAMVVTPILAVGRLYQRIKSPGRDCYHEVTISLQNQDVCVDCGKRQITKGEWVWERK